MKKYFYSKHKINKIDIIKVSKTLKFKELSRGSSINTFEEKLKKITKSKYAIAVNNGTSALIAAIKSLNLKKNSFIAVPNITFIASASSVLLAGHKIILMDVSEETGLVKIDEIKKIIKKKKISCLINVHLNGNIGDLNSIFKVCKKNNVKIIDDSCHALGTKYSLNNKIYNIGDNSHCDISTFSFHPSKLITTGEGGAVLTNNRKIYENLKKISNHGYENYRIKNKNFFHNYYQVKNVGYNFRISDINCALGISQLSKMSDKLKHRITIAKFYNKFFEKNKYIKTLKVPNNIKCAYHLYPIFIENFKKINRIELMNKLKKRNIFTQIHYLPLNRQPLFKKKNKYFPKSQKYFEKTISIPIHENIGIKDAKYIAKTIIQELQKIIKKIK